MVLFELKVALFLIEYHYYHLKKIQRKKVRQHLRVSIAGFLMVTAFSDLTAHTHVIDEAVRWSFLLMLIDCFWKEDGSIDI